MEDNLWPYLLTAGLTLGATLTVHLVIQFYAVPRVDTRKRQEDRWERDLLALGELLTFDYRKAADAYFHAHWFRQWLHAMANDVDVDQDKILAMLSEHEKELRETGT